MLDVASISLEPQHLETVRSILARHVPDCEVRAYGSRVSGTARRYSDLDLVVAGDGALDWLLLAKLREAFSESKLPIMVDVQDWHAIAEWFREEIDGKSAIIQERARPSSDH